MNLKNKVAVITGAASGIGKAIAEKCVAENMKVVISDINQSSLKQLEKKLKHTTPEVLSIVTDATKQADIEKLAQATIEKFNHVNFLFNNVGALGPIGPMWEIPMEAIDHILDINLKSTLHGLKTFIPIMLKQKQENCYIINTASGAAFTTSVNGACYNLSKHAVAAVSESLYYDLKQIKANIHVSLLCPGSVSTNLANTLKTPEKNNNTFQFSKLIEENIKNGMDPKSVAEITFESIQKNKFYIFTHPEQKELIKNRFEDIALERNPSRKFNLN